MQPHPELPPKSALLEKLATVAAVFFSVSARARTSVSREVLSRGSQLDDLIAGRRDMSTATYERTMNWFAENWPSGAEWPEGIERPVVPINTGIPQVGSFQ